MIEIIREENWDDTKEKKLPKDIRQIGRPDVGERIYIEDEVYRYLHPYESSCEKLVYVLLGRFENYSGRQCTFVEAAIQLEHLEFDAEIPRWSDHEWAYIYKRLKDEYDSMVIVGWALDHRGCLPNMTKQIEQFHQTENGYQKEKIKKDTLETMQDDIEKILKEKYPEYSEKHKDDLMCEGYMAVLELSLIHI